MKAEFRALELILESPYVYVERREEDNGGNRIDIWDSVNEAMTILKNKIDEVEKRMECARRCSIEINHTISGFADRLDKGLPVELSLAKFDTVNQCSYDVHNALNMEDTRCIEDDWYNMFTENPVADTVEPIPIPVEAPTMQCRNPETFSKVEAIIQSLLSLDNGNCVDGETMEYILKRVDMDNQVLTQLAPLLTNIELCELVYQKEKIKIN